MNYEEVLKEIHSYDKFGTRLGLERVSSLLNILGNPHKKMKFIHVAGTNGKGSTSAMLSEIFIAEGKTVGLYTSPFVIDFRERMQVCGRMIEKSQLAKIGTEVFEAVKEMADKPTEFEIVTSIAMLWFSRMKCDLVVLEVGLGGIYDATNVIATPLASVITSISFDHMQYLGNTLSEIALNKAGIIKNGGKTILACSQSDETIEVVKEKCALFNNELLVCRNESKMYNGKSFIYKDKLYELSMLGSHQVENAITAIETATLLGAKPTSIRRGIKNAHMPARMEILSRSPYVILDGAHNVEGVEVLCRNIRRFYADKKKISVLAMMEDKQWQESALKIEGISDCVIATEASNPRTLPCYEMAEFLHCTAVKNPKTAFNKALEKYGKDCVILVCGSLYLASDLREIIIRTTK